MFWGVTGLMEKIFLIVYFYLFIFYYSSKTVSPHTDYEKTTFIFIYLFFIMVLKQISPIQTMKKLHGKSYLILLDMQTLILNYSIRELFEDLVIFLSFISYAMLLKSVTDFMAMQSQREAKIEISVNFELICDKAGT